MSKSGFTQLKLKLLPLAEIPKQEPTNVVRYSQSKLKLVKRASNALATKHCGISTVIDLVDDEDELPCSVSSSSNECQVVNSIKHVALKGLDSVKLVRSRPTISSDAMSLKNIHYSDVTPKFSNTVNPHKHIGIPSLSNVLSNSLTNEHAPNLEGNIFIQSSSPCSGYVPLSPTSPLFNSASSIVPPTTTHTDTLAEFSSTFPNPIISDMHDDLFSQQVQLPTFSLRRPIATVKKPFIAGADASNVALVAPPNTSIAPSYKRVITVDDFESEEKPIQTVRASRLFLSAAPSCQMPSSIYLSDACLDQSANDKLQVGSDSGSKSIASIARSISTERVNHPTVSDSINAACVRDRGAAEELRLARQHYTCNLLVNTGLSSRSIGHAKQSTKQFSAAQQLVNSVSANSSTVRELAISSVSARQTCFAPLSVMHGPNHVRFNPILPSAMMTSQSQSRGNCRNPRPLQFERPTAPFQHSSDFPREFDSSGPPNILSSSDSLRDIRNGSKTDTDPYAYLDRPPLPDDFEETAMIGGGRYRGTAEMGGHARGRGRSRHGRGGKRRFASKGRKVKKAKTR